VGLLSAIPRWILVVLVIILVVYLVGMARILTVGEFAAVELPDIVTGLVPTPPPVPPDEVVSPCRDADRLRLAGPAPCEVSVAPGEGYRRLTLVVIAGPVLFVYLPEDGDPTEPLTLPRGDDARAESGIPDGDSLSLVLRCASLNCVLRIEAPGAGT
jgi:hypothetical protein